MRRFHNVFFLKGKSSFFISLRLFSFLFSFLLVLSSILISATSSAENDSSDNFPFLGAYATYIARGVYQGWLIDYSKNIEFIIGSIIDSGPTPESKKDNYLLIKWHIVDFKDPYWVVNFSVSFINATVIVLNLSNEEVTKEYHNTKIIFRAVYFVNKYNGSCYLLETREFLGYWPFWLTRNELNNINMISRRIPPEFRNYTLNISHYYPQIGFLQTKGAGYFVFTNEKLVTYNSSIPPPIILLVSACYKTNTSLWNAGDPAEVFYYETKYGLCIGIKEIWGFSMRFKNNTSIITRFWGFDDFRHNEVIENITKDGLSSKRFIFPGIVIYSTNVDVFSSRNPQMSLPKGPSALVVILGTVLAAGIIVLDVVISKRS